MLLARGLVHPRFINNPAADNSILNSEKGQSERIMLYLFIGGTMDKTLRHYT